MINSDKSLALAQHVETETQVDFLTLPVNGENYPLNRAKTPSLIAIPRNPKLMEKYNKIRSELRVIQWVLTFYGSFTTPREIH